MQMPAVSSVYVRSAEGNLHGPLPGDDISWMLFTMPDVTVRVRGPVAAVTAPAPPDPGPSAVGSAHRAVAAGGSEASMPGMEPPSLSVEEQNWRRVQALYLEEPCPVPRLLQQVRTLPIAWTSLSHAQAVLIGFGGQSSLSLESNVPHQEVFCQGRSKCDPLTARCRCGPEHPGDACGVLRQDAWWHRPTPHHPWATWVEAWCCLGG
mmetsp:Transcript_1004/g.2959  ORF Transcript_1004/g.2959 Transcript_1004/m.2959 type:complete len:207 (-) Transcript_1004:559-1179(-)